MLTPSQLERICGFGSPRSYDRGDVLLAVGARAQGIFVILRGRVEIVRLVRGEEQVLMRLGRGQFTGEVGTLAGQNAIVSIRAAAPTDVIEIARDQLLKIVQTDSELSDVLMRAFLRRRLSLVAGHSSDALLVGSHHSPDMLRIREFLSRNDYPYSIIDVDHDPGAQALLDQFNVTVDDTPIVVCQERGMVRNPSNQELAYRLGFNATIETQAVRDLVIVGAGPSGLG